VFVFACIRTHTSASSDNTHFPTDTLDPSVDVTCLGAQCAKIRHVTNTSFAVCLVAFVNTYVVVIRVLFMHVSSYILNSVNMLYACAVLFSC
jgi:hypothetical protein